jgi:bifunctional DNase/RNase
MIIHEPSGGPVLLLHIPPLDRYLPIWIGPSEAASIGFALKNEKFERPLTHDLVVTIIDGLEGKVSKVVVTDQRDNTFFAKIFIERGQQVIGIDARPSDSIAIAVRTGSPIFVTENVVEREKDSLWTLDPETNRGLGPESAAPPPSGVDPAWDLDPPPAPEDPETFGGPGDEDDPAEGDEPR